MAATRGIHQFIDRREATAVSATPGTALDARYGRTPMRARTKRIVAVVVGAAVLVTSIAWVVWVGVLGPSSALEVRDIGYVDEGEQVSVTWALSVDPGRSASCAVHALNGTHAIVGWRVVEVPPSTERTRQFTETVRVTEPAVTGLIYRCWLT